VRIDAVAWDIDGTLIDSEPLHHQALLDASASFGVDLKDLPPLAFRGVHMDEVWSSLRDRFPATLARRMAGRNRAPLHRLRRSAA
jgi:beta-phosphoglucomutase-like phosphatase (HAD superfamily)